MAQATASSCGPQPGVAPFGDAGLQGAAATPLPAASGRSFAVDSAAAFQKAVGQAGPGDEIVIKNGVYKDWGTFRIDASGTAAAPLILRAETPLGAVFAGDATLLIKGSHLAISGLQFKDTQGWAILAVPGGSQVRITGNRFENTGTEGGREVLRIFAKTDRFEIDNNDFSDINTQAIILYGNTADAQNHRVHHNWFHDTPKRRGNGHEAITSIGGQKFLRVADLGNVIDHNFFERWDGESELISMKAAGYEVRDNTVLDSAGALNIREATKVVMADNIIVNSPGIGVNGSGNRITGNKCYGTGSCLVLFGESKIDKEAAGRQAATDNVIADNLFSSSDSEPIVIVYRDGTVLTPVANNVLENNVIVTQVGSWLKVQGNPDSVFLDRNKVTGSTIFSSAGPLSLPAGNRNEAPNVDLTPPQSPRMTAGACNGG